MGWFDRQIRDRIENNRQQLQKSYWRLASVVAKVPHETFADTQKNADKDALAEIGRYFHMEAPEIPENIKDLEDRMEYLFRPAGIMRRRVKLTGSWWKDGSGPMVAERTDGAVVALIPGRAGGYVCWDASVQKNCKIKEEDAKKIKADAVCFYRPLPQRKLTEKDIFSFLRGTITKQDLFNIGVSALAVLLLGMVLPMATTFLLQYIVPSGQEIMVLSIAVFLVGIAVSKFLFSMIKSMMRSRIEWRMKVALDSAMFARVLNLPVHFFKAYSAGELSERVMATSGICTIFCEAVFGTGLTALFSLGYLFQIADIAPQLLPASAVILAAQLAVAVAGIYGQLQVTTAKLTANSKVRGIVFELYSGIQKIKLAGCEERAFSKWADRYELQADANYNPPVAAKMQKALAPVIAVLGAMILYRTAAGASLSVPQYVAFNTSYGMLSSAILSLTGVASILSALYPILDQARPLLEAQPETSEEREIVKKISGTIELNNVSFQYTEDGPLIIDNLSLRIRSGQYVAIVGTTGCGKSTLMRLMMGFETPQTGAVFYDGKDIQKLDQKSLRRQIGVVMQNGKLFSGDIFSNITISAPWLTMKDAWEAAETAGVADDIRHMPMEMHTILSEGAGGISGGQKQRLMIARAIAAKPNVLMFDEATSALDNITQKQVSESLNHMNSTRIVIAHRLSTIKECDRIIVLDQGHIIEDGTYETLSKAGGFFAELVERQQLQAF